MFCSDLFESQYAPLYHGAPARVAEFILRDDCIKGLTEHHGKKLGRSGSVEGVSLSRSRWFSHRWTNGTGAVFVLDQQKLRQSFIIRPFMYYSGNNAFGKLANPKWYRDKQEAEEFLFGNLANLSRYLLRIEITDRALEIHTGIPREDLANAHLGELTETRLLSHPLLKVIPWSDSYAAK